MKLIAYLLITILILIMSVITWFSLEVCSRCKDMPDEISEDKE